MAKSSRFHRAMKRRKEIERQEKQKLKEERREALKKAAAEAKERGEEVYTSDQDLVRGLEGPEGEAPAGGEGPEEEKGEEPPAGGGPADPETGSD